MFLRFPARFNAYIYASMHMRACARAEKACKGTTFFRHDQIFLKENAKNLHFFFKMQGLDDNSYRIRYKKKRPYASLS